MTAAVVYGIDRDGEPLTAADYGELAQCYITPDVANSARLFRVSSDEGRRRFGHGGSEDYSGIVFSYYRPGESRPHSERLRRSNPPFTFKHGVRKADRRYLSAAGWPNVLYFHPNTPPSALSDTNQALAFTEGQKKCLALWRFAHEASPARELPLFLPVGLNGVWGFRGTTGKTTNEHGQRISEKGVIADFDRIEWSGRRVYIIYDTNVATNASVAAARRELAYELRRRGADVVLVDLPEENGINGVDDYLARHGASEFLRLLQAGSPFDPSKDSTNVAQLADEITAATHFAQDASGKLYVFEDGCYKPTGETFIRRRVKALYNDWGIAHAWSVRRADEVAEYIRVDAPELWQAPPRDVLNVRNGLLNVLTGELRPHSPDHLSPIQLPVQFDPKARCEFWDRFVADVFPADSEAIAWEIVAWAMTPDKSIQKAVLLSGEGANGKSRYLNAVLTFLGRQNTAAVSLHKLEQDRFTAARLLGKLANICPDLPSDHLAGTSMFKALTGGDVICAERKFHDSFEFAPYAKLLFSANQPPRSDDHSHGFFRRWLVIPFNRCFEGADALPADVIDARLSDPAELSGVLNKALLALKQLRRQGFTLGDSMRQAWDEFRQATDPFSVWLDTNVVVSADAVVPKRDICAAYNQFCTERGRPNITATAFGLAIRRAIKGLNEAQRTVSGRLQWCFVGIGLKAQRSEL